MSEIRKVVSFQPITVKIDCINKKTVCDIEISATNALEQKLEKLNTVIKNLNVYCVDNVLLVNDRYGICRDFIEIASAFGLDVEQINCGLRGKTYVAQDKLVALIRAINPQFSIQKYANCSITPELAELVKSHVKNYGFDSFLTKALQEIKIRGYYELAGKQIVTEVYDDKRLIDRRMGEVSSNKDSVTEALQAYSSQAAKTLKSANENLRDGTVKLLYSRARQMGYSVREERQGEQVQLVLVRNE